MELPTIISIHGLSSAFRTLTVVPLPVRESKDLSSSLPWFPVVGLFMGFILWGIAFLWRLMPFGQWAAGAAIILLIFETGFTRGLHLDGLADWADSLGGLHTREKRLEIMRDSKVGAFGVMALIILLIAKWVLFERIISSESMIWFILIPVISRDMLVELITTLPYARSGSGMGKAFVEGASQKHRWISHAFCLIFCIPFGPLGLIFWGLAFIVTRIFGKRCRKAFGGITGDLMGTENEMIEWILLFLCAVPAGRVLGYTGWGWMLF